MSFELPTPTEPSIRQINEQMRRIVLDLEVGGESLAIPTVPDSAEHAAQVLRMFTHFAGALSRWRIVPFQTHMSVNADSGIQTRILHFLMVQRIA